MIYIVIPLNNIMRIKATGRIPETSNQTLIYPLK